jgi:dihydrofolate reductase
MRKLVIGEFISLDGVIQAPGGVDEDRDGGFAQGAWTLPFWHDEIGAYFVDSMKECDTFLLGRRTWQTHGAAFDPLPAGDAFGDIMNGMKKYVVSTTLGSAALWRNSSIIRGDVPDEVRRLKAMPGKNIYLDGSSVLAHTLIEHDMVDEYSLLVYPIILGSGKKLFPDGEARHTLSLVESRPFPTGVVLMRYARARE